MALRERIRVLAAACFYYAGLVKLAYWWIQRSGPRLVILNYHRASGGDLRILAGPELDPMLELELLGALECDSHLFLRYAVSA